MENNVIFENDNESTDTHKGGAVWVEGEWDAGNCRSDGCGGEGDVGKYLFVGSSYSVWGDDYGGARYGKNLTFTTGGVDACDCDEIMKLVAVVKPD